MNGTLGAAAFKRSSYCSLGTCVEVALNPEGGAVVRDGKHPDGPLLTFSSEEWEAFVRGVKNDEFSLS